MGDTRPGKLCWFKFVPKAFGRTKMFGSIRQLTDEPAMVVRVHTLTKCSLLQAKVENMGGTETSHIFFFEF